MPLMKDPQGHEVVIALAMVTRKLEQGWNLCENSEAVIAAAALASSTREQTIAPAGPSVAPRWVPRSQR